MDYFTNVHYVVVGMCALLYAGLAVVMIIAFYHVHRSSSSHKEELI